VARNAIRADERRLRLINAAAALVAEAGYEGASIKEICSRAGVAIGTFYANFDDKTDLFAQAAAIAPRLELTEVELADRTQLQERIERFFRTDLTLTAAWQEAERSEPDLRARTAARAAEDHQRVARAVLEVRREAGRPIPEQDATTVAWLITTLLREAVLDRPRLPRSIGSSVAAAIWLLVYGIGLAG